MTPSTRAVLLFDVDGVLIHPAGYKAALRATVRYFASRMGLPDHAPTEDEIAVFEACGITNEWDSGAICIAALLRASLAADPALARTTLDDTYAAIRRAGLALARPDYAALARSVPHVTADAAIVPAARYLGLLSEQNPEHLPLLAALLGDVYGIDALTTRVFQAFSLGSARYAEVYGDPAPVECESAITTHDVPLLTPENRDRLLAWRAAPGHAAAIFTARPSLPPPGASQPRANGFSPEAELALARLGLEGQLPLIGQGRVGWLAHQRGRNTADYTKPSPVQALAAIGAAISGDEGAALHAAVTLAEAGRLEAPLAALRDQHTTVTVLEDGIGGIRATRSAVDLLREAGLDAHARAIGIATHPAKRAALARVSEHVADDVNGGLAWFWDSAG